MSTNNLIQQTNAPNNSNNPQQQPQHHVTQQSSNASVTNTTATHTNVLSLTSPSGSGGITFAGGGSLGHSGKTLSRIVVRKASAGGVQTVQNFVYGSSGGGSSSASGGGGIGLGIQQGSSSGSSGGGGGVLHHLVDTPNSTSNTIIPSSLSVTQPPPPHSFVVGGGGSSTSSNSGGGGGGGNNKPQSQINKCLNEKRRREQENIYIEELAELISASIEDMSSLSVKPDKCAILQETVNQIRRIKATEDPCSSTAINSCSSSGSGGSSSSSGQVQQGEVSSSTNILANEILCPLVLEALDGFLFVVNGDGIVEFVSDNVTGFINFVPADLIAKSIYNVIHLTDHARFSSSLLPMSIAGWNNNSNQQQPQPQQEEQSPQKHQRTFNIRVLTKSDRSENLPFDDPQTTSSHYENMQITAMLMPPSISPPPTTTSALASTSQSSSSLDTRLVCIARRLPPNERAPGLPVEQFTTKLKTDGHIIGLDTSGLSPNWAQFLKKEQIVNTALLQELVFNADLTKLTAHLRDTCKSGSSTSPVYRMNFGEKVVMVQTKSKVFAFNPNTEPDFIMATHTIIHNENDSPPPPPSIQPQSAPQTPNPLTPRQTPTPTTSTNIPSSPVMIKKQPATPTSSCSTPLTPMLQSPHHNPLHHQDSNNNENNNLLLTSTPTPSPQQQQQQQNQPYQTLTLQQSTSDYDFNLDLWPEFDLDSNFPSAEPQQQQQQPQPRTNQPIASPAPPNLAATWGVTNSPLSNASNSPFNPQPQEQEINQPTSIGSDRLRNLLTLNQLEKRNDNRILKTLLNADDEQSDQPNNMLLRLLNNTGAAAQSSPDEPMRRGTELLQQLLNEDNTSPQASGVKRTFSQMMEEQKWQQPVSLPPPPPPKGDLCKRNPRLVSLLQKPSDPPSPVPLVPPGYLSITPQEKMNKIRAQQQQQQSQQPQYTQNRNNLLNNLLNNSTQQRPQQQQPHPPISPQISAAASASRSTPSPHQIASPQPLQQQQILQNNMLCNQSSSSTIDSSDAILDEILDQVIDIVPEDLKLLSGASDLGNASTLVSGGASGGNTSGGGATLLVGNQNQILGQSGSGQSSNLYSDDVSNILNLLESNADIPATLLTSTQQVNSPQTPTTPLSAHTPSDMAKIDAIQKELMQFETIHQITTTFQNTPQSPQPQPTTPTTLTPQPMLLQQPQQHVNQQISSPLLIQRTTTTSTIARFRSPPNQIVPNHQQQLLKQQMLLRQQQQQNPQQQHHNQQRLLQQQGILQQLQELKNRSGNTTVNIQNLDSLLSGNVPPPNVTLTTNGGATATATVFERIVGGQVQQVTQQPNTIVGNLVGNNGNLLVQQVQQNQNLVNNTGGIVIGQNVNLSQAGNQQQLQQLQQQQLLRLSIQQQQLHNNQQYNPISSLTQSNQLNSRIVMNNQQTQQWVNQNKARISIQQQNNPMLNAQLGASVGGGGGGGNPGNGGNNSPSGINAQLQQQLLLRQQQQQNFQQQQQQQQQFMFRRQVAGQPGVQQQVVTNQQLHLLQQQQLNNLQLAQQQLTSPTSPSPQQLNQPLMLPQQIITSHSNSLPSSPIDVRPGLRAVVGARTLGAQLGVLNIPHSVSSPLVVVSSSSGVPDLDALGFSSSSSSNNSNNGNNSAGQNNNTGGSGGGVLQTKVSI